MKSFKYTILFILPFFTPSYGTEQGPDFLIIGSPKCGTSSLYSYITQHPQVQRVHGKELNFFDRNYKKGLGWYYSQFPAKKKASNLTGEATPEYLCTPLCARRIKRDLPDIKLIIILRNPVDRAYSSYQHGKRAHWPEVTNHKGNVESFEQCISSPHSKLLKRGLYIKQLKRWFSIFTKKKILILRFEELIQEPQKVMNRVYNFLGLAPYNSINFTPQNSGGAYQKMNPVTRKFLVEYFVPYNKLLEDYLGMKFDWK